MSKPFENLIAEAFDDIDQEFADLIDRVKKLLDIFTTSLSKILHQKRHTIRTNLQQYDDKFQYIISIEFLDKGTIYDALSITLNPNSKKSFIHFHAKKENDIDSLEEFLVERAKNIRGAVHLLSTW